MHPITKDGKNDPSCRIPKRVTMGDVALESGVSRPTVSRALRNDPLITQATTQRVQEAARKLGYQRDPAFDILAQQRKQFQKTSHRLTLGFLAGTDKHAKGFLVGIQTKAAELGYKIDVFRLSDYKDAKSLNRQLLARGIRGLFIPAFRKNDILPDLEWNRFAVVACNVSDHRLPFHLVRTNVVRKLELAWNKCRDRGYRRIAIACAVSPHEPHELEIRRLGVAKYYISTLKPADQIPIWRGTTHEADDIATWLAKWKPDALIAGQKYMIPQIDQYIANSKANLPHCCLMEVPNRSSLSSEPETIGRAAMTVLHQQIIENALGPPEAPFTVVTEPTWLEGGSL